MVADSLVYHPTVTHFNKFVATTVGRDKALRTIQYFSRFLSWYTYRTNSPQSTVALFAAIKTNFGLVRKCLRIGKFVEHLRAAGVATNSTALDPVLRFCSVGRQLGYAGYLFSDMLTYPDAAGIRKWESAKRIQREAYRFWMAGLLCSIASGGYTLYRMRVEGKKAEVVQGTDAEKSLEGKRMVRYVHQTCATSKMRADRIQGPEPSPIAAPVGPVRSDRAIERTRICGLGRRDCRSCRHRQQLDRTFCSMVEDDVNTGVRGQGTNTEN